MAQLGNMCRCRSGACTRPGGGRHDSCAGSAARKAAVYPFRLCKAILSGVRNQLREDGRFTHGTVGIQPAPQDGLSDEQLETRVNRLWNIDVEDESSEEMGPLERDPEFQALNGNKKLQKQYRLLAVLKIEEQPQNIFTDDLTGQLLDPTMAKAARRVELEYFEAKGVWERRKREECLRNTGKNPISVRWVDISKGDDATPNYRSRLVARDIRKKIRYPRPPHHWRALELSYAWQPRA